MVQLERMNGEIILVNPDHIRFVEMRPDCLITFYDGKTLLVRSTLQDLENKILRYRQTVGTTATWMQQPSLASS